TGLIAHTFHSLNGPWAARVTRGTRGGWFDSPLRQIYHPRGMGQQRCATARIFFFWCVAALAAGCRDGPAASTSRPSSGGAMRVASLAPAATDLILGMGAGDHLVAVSNYDAAEIGGRKLPQVGDYQ